MNRVIKDCVNCGEKHYRNKFCSVKCRAEYWREGKFGLSKISHRNVDSIILNNKKEGLNDHGFSFVFSSNIEDWMSLKLHKRRKKDKEKYQNLIAT
tara:strand:- start:208 stop:495 length:288 start_codon:yes stop_codon:yes gene_type:complete